MNFQILSKILGIYTTLQELEMLHSEPHPHRGYSTKSYAGRLPPPYHFVYHFGRKNVQ